MLSDGDEKDEYKSRMIFGSKLLCSPPPFRPRPYLTFHRVMAGEGSNSFRYMRFLNRSAEGRCLWYPTETGTIGDVGYVREGYFIKVTTRLDSSLTSIYATYQLFNVSEAPDPLPSLPTSPGTALVNVRSNKHTAWMFVDGGAHRVGASVPVARRVC